MNVELLLKVKEQVLAHPERVDMHEFLAVDVSSESGGGVETLTSFWADSDLAIDYRGKPDEFVACNTTACIAGWVMVLTPVEKRRAFCAIPLVAMEQLELDDNQAARLFYLEDWPIRFGLANHVLKSHQGRAQVVADRIDHFIATGGEE